jgi:hypothetical protein
LILGTIDRNIGSTKIPLSGDWTEVVWQGKIDAATPWVRVSFVFKSMPAGAKVWIDDLSVVSE